MSEAMVKLLPCPHCGNETKLSVREWMEEPGAGWGYYVRCDASGFDGQRGGRGCGASSGWGETPSDAIEAWNRRAKAGAGEAVDTVANLLLKPVAWASKEALREARITVPHSLRAYTSKNPDDHDLDTPLYTAEQLLSLLPAHEAGLTSPDTKTAPLADREKSADSFECENCIGMQEHGCYCAAMGASSPGGHLATDWRRLWLNTIVAGRRMFRIGGLHCHIREISGGPYLGPLTPDIWNTEHTAVRFGLCLIDLNNVYHQTVAGPQVVRSAYSAVGTDFRLIFVDERSLANCLDAVAKVSPPPAWLQSPRRSRSRSQPRRP